MFRLLGARSFRNLFDARPDADLGLIVPDRLLTETAGRGGLTIPEKYRELRVTNKGTRLKARVGLPPTLQNGKPVNPLKAWRRCYATSTLSWAVEALRCSAI